MLNNAKVQQKRSTLLAAIELKNHTDNANRYIAPLIDAGLIDLTIKDKPQSQNQRYIITTKGLQLLNAISSSSNSF
ncbi:hypothetical protein G8O23_02730 [Bacteroidales bacterium M08MB]|nr:hypothetical protein [Perlabentimonas gracilis]